MPGETARVPVWVRGMGGGKQPIKILVRYERDGVGLGQAPAGEGQRYR